MTDSTAEARQAELQPVSQAWRGMVEQERNGLYIAAAVRTAFSLIVLIWQVIEFPFEGLAYAYGVAAPATFVLLGAGHMLAARYAAKPLLMAGALFALDIIAMAFFFTYANPFAGPQIPLYMAYRWDNFFWYFVLLAQSAMSLNWLLVAWCGLLAALARLMQLLVILAFSDSFTEYAIDVTDPFAVVNAYQDAAYVSTGMRFAELLAIFGSTAGLVAVVQRSRRLASKFANAERGRASLARYFSPNTVNALLTHDDAWRQPKRQNVVVMFLDIVGFAQLCANRPPEEAVKLLRGYHDRVVEQVFAFGGTLDKYMGDGVMVTFGTPYAISNPASCAWDCAAAIQAGMAAWNVDRSKNGLEPVAIGAGLHIGEAVIGDIGNHRRLEFAVIGDVVNRTARLEALTRRLNADIVVSDAFYQALAEEGHSLDDLTAFGPQTLRGIDEKEILWGRERVARAQEE